jgi:Rrf2 family protein
MRLDLTKRADYAIRAMLAITRAGDGQRLSVRRVAAEQGIPMQILPRIMSDLVRAGLVASVAGRTGGYELARAPSTVSLLDVIEAVEGDARRRNCVLRGGACRLAGVCDVHAVFYEAQEALLATLAAASLEQIAEAG